MTQEQVTNLKLGIAPIDDRVIILVESAFNWINDNTSLVLNCNDDEVLKNLSANVKLFIIKYVDIMTLSPGITSESIEGLSQSYDVNKNKTDLIWQYANELLGNYIASQLSFVTAKSGWTY